MSFASLPVMIVRYTDSHQPGFVECQFTDIHCQTYTSGSIKQVYATKTYVDENTPYPVPGAVHCNVVSSHNGVSRITTCEPWLEIEADNHEFEVSTASLILDEPLAQTADGV